MSRILSITAMLFSLILLTPAQAGSGHTHDAKGGHSNHGHSHGPINSKRAAAKAERKVANLVKKGKIHKSWAGIKAGKVEKKKFKKGNEWVVTFENPKVKDADKQKLYIFYSLDGHYIAANHTGK